MNVLDKTYITHDEEYNASGRISNAIDHELQRLKMDTYNQQYIVHITVATIEHEVEEEKV